MLKILLALCFLLGSSAIVQASPLLGPEHYIAKYVPWGVDEFEIFGLTKPEVEKKFGKELHSEFGAKEGKVYFSNPEHGPQFLVTLENGKIETVRRLFVDGEGCHILGPVLKTKKEALQFSVDGLTKLESTDPNDKAKLATARKLLQESH